MTTPESPAPQPKDNLTAAGIEAEPTGWSAGGPAASTHPVGHPASPLRVAIIGAGPAGFYVADGLLSQQTITVEVDVVDRLPHPFGLVRSGVAPDHQNIKKITRVFDRVAARPNFRFYGNVAFGEHLTLEDLRAHYHQVVFATGAMADRRLGIPGEHLAGSYSAT